MFQVTNSDVWYKVQNVQKDERWKGQAGLPPLPQPPSSLQRQITVTSFLCNSPDLLQAQFWKLNKSLAGGQGVILGRENSVSKGMEA